MPVAAEGFNPLASCGVGEKHLHEEVNYLSMEK
jgi:hypothetical protein